jgi:Trk-type K+ transport system membrane component
MKLTWLYRIAVITSFSGLAAMVVELGFAQSAPSLAILHGFYLIVLVVSALATVFRHIEKRGRIKRNVRVFDALTTSFTLVLLYLTLFCGESHTLALHLAVVFAFIRECSDIRIKYKTAALNPAQIFIASFLFIIFVGTLLLLLPRATHNGVSLTDAMFTSTSAVCITGLSTVDVGACYTRFGQGVLMLLVQIGGLGILTFTSYFSYFFRGGATYENQFFVSDITNSQKISKVFSTLKYIIWITFSIEAVAAVCIYASADAANFTSEFDRIFFALFHAIMSFCNAGFTSVPDAGLCTPMFSFNYGLQTVMLLTFILGGLGFPIIVNIINYFKYKIPTLLLAKKRKTGHRAWVLNIDSKITLITTACLTVAAFTLFYVFEYNNTLSEHHGVGKVVVALFGAASPRSAGFNTVDTGALSLPLTLIMLAFMWIGSSPASTGGGIKTSTFAIALLNIASLARGKSRIEVFGREIATVTVRRALAIITLSLIMIGTGVVLVASFDGDKTIKSIVFECVSAYSTAGMSLGITADLSVGGKFVIMAMMFVGRVTMLSIIIAVVKKTRHKNHRYPGEELILN